MTTAGDSAQIEDYALIGDCRTAALVSSQGSIDWLCWPRFDSPAIFAGLLDGLVGGSWSIHPSTLFEADRCYESSSNVLATTFRTDSGSARLTDLFFAASEDYKRHVLLPQAMVIRRLECLDGSLEAEVHFNPKPDFARGRVQLKQRSAGAWSLQLRDGLVLLATSMRLSTGDEGLEGRVVLKQGERAVFILAFEENGPAVFPPIHDVDHLVDVTNDYWRRWAERMAYDGPHPEAVLRSGLLLKLLTYSPSGAIVAAPTSSLPEKIGAAYNWDYRFCWLRDASYTVNAFLGLGMREEAIAFLQWLLHATRLTQPRLQVLYSVLGKPSLKERQLDHLSGYRGSRPVRVGNAAHGQLQLDVYGEVINAASLCYQQGQQLSGDEKSLLIKLADYIMQNWQRPDSGLWETRGEPRQFLHSKVICWLGLQRVLALTRDGRLKANEDELSVTAARIAETIRERGFNEAVGSYVDSLDGEQLDASALRIPILEFESANDPRSASTIETIRRELARGDLVLRHRGEETGGEGGFLICSFWLVQCLALQGRLKEANGLFHALCARANDVGLYSEEIDIETGSFLGNFPQAFTHIGLINAALTLSQASKPEGEPA